MQTRTSHSYRAACRGILRFNPLPILCGLVALAVLLVALPGCSQLAAVFAPQPEPNQTPNDFASQQATSVAYMKQLGIAARAEVWVSPNSAFAAGPAGIAQTASHPTLEIWTTSAYATATAAGGTGAAVDPAALRAAIAAYLEDREASMLPPTPATRPAQVVP